MTFHTDCKYVRDGFLSGRHATTHCKHTYADLWRKVWDAIEDVGLLFFDYLP